MMRVRLTTDRAMLLGPAQRDGDIIEVPDSEGLALIATRQAETIETAMLLPETNRNSQRSPGRNTVRK